MLKKLTLLLFIPFTLQAQEDDLKIKTGSFDFEVAGRTYLYEGEYVISKERGSKEKLPHGKGKLMQPENMEVEKMSKKGYSLTPYLYDGEWKLGVKHGKGLERIFRLKDGKTFEPAKLWSYFIVEYEGFYSDGLYDGKGTHKTLDFEYSGDFKAGKKHGEGSIQYVKQPSPPTAQRMKQVKVKEKYEGGWEEDMFHGKGTFTSFEKNESFTGEFENHAFKKGLYTYKDDNTYDGEWKDGLPSGKGTYTWKKTGDIYVGEFVAGEPKGQGKYTSKDGNYLEGVFEGWNCTGKGRMTYQRSFIINDSKTNLSGIYEGDIRNNIPHGIGTFTVKEGQTEFEISYLGGWQEGKRHGKGSCVMYQNIYVDGKWSRDAQAYQEKYDGEWNNDKYHGRGEWFQDYFGNASEYTSDFFEGVFHGKGTHTYYTMAYPQFYIGRFRNGHFLDGQFVYIDEDDNEISEFQLGNDYFGEWIIDPSSQGLCGNGLFFEIYYAEDGGELGLGYSTEWWGDNISISFKDDLFIFNYTHHGEMGESTGVESALIMQGGNLYFSMTGKKEDLEKMYKCK
jgi:hypothetical protein